MKINLFFMLSMIFTGISAQDFNINIFEDDSKTRMVQMLSSNEESSSMLKVSRNYKLHYCNVQRGIQECSEVLNYKKYVVKNKLHAFDIYKVNDNEFAIFFYKKISIKQKEVYKAIYSLSENSISPPELIHTISGYSLNTNYQGLFRLVQSENKEHMALVEFCSKPSVYNTRSNLGKRKNYHLTKTKGLLTIIYLDQDLNVTEAHTNPLNYQNHAPPDLQYNYAFLQYDWPRARHVLTNEGNFYLINNERNYTFVNQFNKNQKKITIETFPSKTFNGVLPTINEKVKKGIELWSILKNENSNKIELQFHKSINGEELTRSSVKLDNELDTFLQLDKNDAYLKISTIIINSNNETYFSLSPVSLYPSYEEDISFQKMTINGIFIFKLERNNIIPIHKKRFVSKQVLDSTIEFEGSYDFSWALECDSKLLFFFNETTDDKTLYTNKNGKINGVIIDNITRKSSDLDINIPKFSIYIDSSIPEIYNSKNKKIVVMHHNSLFYTNHFIYISSKD